MMSLVKSIPDSVFEFCVVCSTAKLITTSIRDLYYEYI
jgi:hypothetical protein